MSRKGNCWDNAPAESFFKTLKAELQIDRPFAGYSETRKAVFSFIELWVQPKTIAFGHRLPDADSSGSTTNT